MTNYMDDSIACETIGAKAQAVFDAKRFMVKVGGTIGMVHCEPAEITLTVRGLEDVNVEVMPSGTIYIERIDT